MSQDQKPPRRPFGERDSSEREIPFGSRSRQPNGSPTPPTAPFSPRRRPEPPPDEPPIESAPPPRSTAPPQPQPHLPAELESEDDPSALSWGELLEEVDQRPAPPPETTDLPDETAVAQPTGRLRPLRSREVPTYSYIAEEAEETATAGARIRFGVVFRTLGALALAGALVATLLTWWTPASFLPPGALGQLAVAQATRQATQQAIPADPANTIGIVSGHRGLNPTSGLPDPGALCADGLSEQSVNENVAVQVAALLQGQGFHVDVLDEFDPRLTGYRALVVISIHADSCEYINDAATGFKVASFVYTTAPEADARLVTCLINHYAAATGLPVHPSVTYDMTEYHNFREIAAGTPGAIIEIGFMYLDRDVLTNRSADVARGIYEGLLCFIRGESPAGGSETPATNAPVTP